LWEVETGQVNYPPFRVPSSPVTNMALNPDGFRMAVSGCERLEISCDKKVILLWEREDRLAALITEHKGSVTALAFSPNGQWLASGSDDTTVRMWDAGSGFAYFQPFTGHSGAVTGVAFSPDGQMLASGGADNTVILWDVISRPRFGAPMPETPPTGAASLLSPVAFSPDGALLASSGVSNTVIIWDTASRQVSGSPLLGHSAWVNSVAFSPDGKILASGSEDNTIIFWDVATRRPISSPLNGNEGPVGGLAFSPDGKILISGHADGRVIVWDVATRRPIGNPVLVHAAPIVSVVFSADGGTVALGSVNDTVVVWDVATRKGIVPSLYGFIRGVNSIALRPDGTGFVWPWNDCSAAVVDIPARQARGDLATIRALGCPAALTFSPDGRTLAWGVGQVNQSTYYYEDLDLSLWDVTNRNPLGPSLVGYQGNVMSMKFSLDGRLLATGYDNQAVVLWDFRPETWMAVACEIAARNLTRAEWEQLLPGEPYRQTCEQWPLEGE
jgi:WD40 repeat protein